MIVIARTGATSRRRVLRTAVTVGLTVGTVGCLYSMRSGGGLPRDIRTMAVVPFTNSTSAAEIQGELYTAMRKDLEGRLGVREVAVDKADALVRGSIERYEADLPVSYTTAGRGTATPRRKLEVVVNVEIVNQKSGKTIWQRRGLLVDGQYEERAEADGRRQAIDQIISRVVEGAQSQW